MYKLTTGDLRLIDESTRAWQMTIDPVLAIMEELPREVLETIAGLSDKYKEGLKEYYLKAMTENDRRLADPVFLEFDQKWEKEHPEFYDMDKLFEKASAADKERAKEALKTAKEILA